MLYCKHKKSEKGVFIMAFLKKFWPYSFTVKAKDVTSLVVNIIISLLQRRLSR